MTVDEVAGAVGIAKASLYKHFPSKEDLAAAAMAHLMQAAQTMLDGVDTALPPLDKLRAVVEWTMRLKLSGHMPTLPSQNSTLRAALMAQGLYGWADGRERAPGRLDRSRPGRHPQPRPAPIAVLYTLFARACDPVLEFLKMSDGLTTTPSSRW